MLVVLAFFILLSCAVTYIVAKRRVGSPPIITVDPQKIYIKQPCARNHADYLTVETGLYDPKKSWFNLITFCETMDRHGIDYTITRGTLVGLMREGGLLSHDKDVDVAVHIHDFDRIEELVLPDLYLKGFQCFRHRGDRDKWYDEKHEVITSVVRGDGNYIDLLYRHWIGLTRPFTHTWKGYQLRGRVAQDPVAFVESVYEDWRVFNPAHRGINSGGTDTRQPGWKSPYRLTHNATVFLNLLIPLDKVPLHLKQRSDLKIVEDFPGESHRVEVKGYLGPVIFAANPTMELYSSPSGECYLNTGRDKYYATPWAVRDLYRMHDSIDFRELVTLTVHQKKTD